MKRTLFTLMAAGIAAGFAVSATALPIVSIVPSATLVPQGSTVTLSVQVTVASGAPDPTDTSLFGALVYPSSGIVSPSGGASPGGQTILPGTGGAFILGTLGSCTTLRCVVFSQSSVSGAVSSTESAFVIATSAYTVGIATPVNTVLTWTWQTTPTGFRLDFFGLTNAPNVQVTVVAIPEPTTVALLGLGIIGLAVAGRRRA